MYCWDEGADRPAEHRNWAAAAQTYSCTDVHNDPVNLTDPTGLCPKCVIFVGKVIFKSGAKGKNPLKAGADEIVGIADDASTIFSNPLSFDAAIAVLDIAVGTEFNNPKTKTVKVSRSKSPESAQHLEDAGATGVPLTVDRAGRDQRRRDNMQGQRTQSGTDRDEAPPAVFSESEGASVRNIPNSDNRSAGAQIGNQIRDVPDGGCVTIEICD